MYVARMEENNNTLTLLAGRPEGKRTLERGKPRWEVIFILIKSMRWGLDSSGLCERGDKISGFTKRLKFLGWLRNSDRIKKDCSRESLLSDT
jgi:hypothetical protein